MLTNGTSEFGVRIVQDGAVKLYHDNATRLDTTSTGVDVTGKITFDGGTTSADLNFGDNDAAVFGGGSDLTISHNVSDSRIINNTGNLLVRSLGVGDSILVQTDNGSGGLDTAARFDGSTRETVLYANGGEKVRTKSTGVDVTGSINSTGNYTITNTEPKIILSDSDATSTFRNTWLVRYGDNFDIQLRDSSNSYIASPLLIRHDVNGAYRHEFKIGSSEKLRIDSDGLKFNGDTAALNALDDYEQGTWTPVVADANTGGNTGTASTAQGEYTKIGNLVYVKFALISISTTGLSSGNDFYVRNLPFTIANTATASLDIGGCVVSGGVAFSGSVSPGGFDATNSMRFAEVISGSNFDWITVSQMSGATLYVSLTYRT